MAFFGPLNQSTTFMYIISFLPDKENDSSKSHVTISEPSEQLLAP